MKRTQMVQTTETAAGSLLLSGEAVVAVAVATPITIFVLVAGVLSWRAQGLPPAGQAYTLKLLDRLAGLARVLCAGNRGRRG